MTPDLWQIALAAQGIVLVALIIHARATAKALTAVENDLDAFMGWARDNLPDETKASILARLATAEGTIDKLDSAYTRLRGTVARLHRSDVRPADESEAAVPAPGDESARFAYKEKLRDSARQRGILK